MCPPRRPRRPTPAPPPRIVEPRPTAESSPTADRMAGRVERTLPPPAPTPSTFVEAKAAQPTSTPPPQALTPPAPTEPAPKMRTIGRTSVRAGTTVSGQQTTSTAAPSRRRRQTARMGRRAGTRSLRISRNPNTGQGDLLY